MYMNISTIIDNLQNLSEKLKQDLENICATKYSVATKELILEIKPESFKWRIVCYPMDGENNQTADGYTFLKEFQDVGILVSQNLKPQSDEEFAAIELFVEENKPEILDAIASWLSEIWLTINKDYNLPIYLTEVDNPDQKYDLTKGKFKQPS